MAQTAPSFPAGRCSSTHSVEVTTENRGRQPTPTPADKGQRLTLSQGGRKQEGSRGARGYRWGPAARAETGRPRSRQPPLPTQFWWTRRAQAWPTGEPGWTGSAPAHGHRGRTVPFLQQLSPRTAQPSQERSPGVEPCTPAPQPARASASPVGAGGGASRRSMLQLHSVRETRPGRRRPSRSSVRHGPRRAGVSEDDPGEEWQLSLRAQRRNSRPPSLAMTSTAEQSSGFPASLASP